MMTFDLSALEDIWVCPNSKSKLVVDGNGIVCVEPGCRLRYDIVDEIPIMLVDSATQLTAEEWGSIMQKCGRDSITGETGNCT